MPFRLSVSFGFFFRTSWYCSSAISALRLFSGVSMPGTYKPTYAVARYSRATPRLGSSATAFLKCSMASSNLAALYDCTPLFSWSRALSLLQPVESASSTANALTPNHLALLFILVLLLSIRNAPRGLRPEENTNRPGGEQEREVSYWPASIF